MTSLLASTDRRHSLDRRRSSDRRRSFASRAAAPDRELRTLDDVAVTIDLHGIDRVGRSVIDQVLALAAAANASPVLSHVLGDEAEPAPVRERAFGKLALQIGTGAPHAGFTLAA